MLVVVLCIVSGVVAWAGDTLGRVLGKRRIAVLGLRPRRTSLLIAIITGILITAGTILTLALSSEGVRLMLTRIDQIRSDLSHAVSERDQAFAERDEARVAVDAMKGAIAEAHLELERLQIQNEDYRSQLSTSQEELAGLTSQVNDLNIEIDSLGNERDDLKAENERLIADREEQVEALNAQINGLSGRIRDLESDITERENRVTELNQQIATLNEQIVAMAQGEVKVVEGQQLGAVLLNKGDSDSVNIVKLTGLLRDIPSTFQDPETGEKVLSLNTVSSDSYGEVSRVLDQIRIMPVEQVVVIAYAVENVFESEPVQVRLDVKGYYKIFNAGSVIFSMVYEMPEGAGDPYRATLAHFNNDVGEYLKDELNFIPVGSGDVMQFTVDDLISLAHELSDIGFPAKISMVALKDIYSADFLLYGEHFSVTIQPSEEPD